MMNRLRAWFRGPKGPREDSDAEKMMTEELAQSLMKLGRQTAELRRVSDLERTAREAIDRRNARRNGHAQ